MFDLNTSSVPTYGVGGSRAKTSAWPIKGRDRDWPEQEVAFSIDLLTWLERSALDGWFSRTSSDSLMPVVERISRRSSSAWTNSGISWRGECWTRNTSEAPSDADEPSLSQVICRTAPLESFLAPEPLQKWMDRHSSLGRTLPADLVAAIETQICTLSSMRRSGESQVPALKPRGTDSTVSLTPSTPEEVPTLYVRRMLASEYERLQGFPENWTDIDSEP